MNINRFPEKLGIYESMLDMSICRGDLPSAKLAFRAISLFSKDPVETLTCILTKVSLIHFSVLPEEVIRLDMEDAWPIISGMCTADLDKRAYSIACLFMRERLNPITHNFIRWKKSHEPYSLIPTISTYIDKLLYEVVLSMNRKLPDKEYFQYSGLPFDSVESTCVINPEYYLGINSWINPLIINYISVISGLTIEDAENILNIMECHSTNKVVLYEHDYWTPLKTYLLKDGVAENLWKTSLRKKVLSQVIEILETRVPILTLG